MSRSDAHLDEEALLSDDAGADHDGSWVARPSEQGQRYRTQTSNIFRVDKGS